MSLFAKAKAAAATTAPKANDKVRVLVKDPDFFQKVQMLEMLQDNMKRDKAKADMLADEIKDTARQEWVNLYEKTGKNPGSIFIDAKSGADLATTMFVPSDKYISVNEDRAKVLVDKFGDEIIEEKTTFSFDNDMIDKYGEILSRLIETCDEIEDDDKFRIIRAVAQYSVAKGTIDRFSKFGTSVSEMMDEVKPVIALKNVEVIKG